MKSSLIALLASCLCLPVAGLDKKKLLPKDIPSLNALAEKGDARAQTELGRRYFQGDEVEENFQEAVKWWRKAAEQGGDSAQYNLGWMYSNGKGVEQNAKEAVKLFRKSAMQGNAEAQHNLGIMYYNGRGVQEDYMTAYAWATIAIFNGQSIAEKIKAYTANKMTPAQTIRARELSKELHKKIEANKSAKLGDVKAQYEVGLSYYLGVDVEKDVKEAVQWYRNAAEQGHAEAQYGLGVMYANGEGVPEDDKEAVIWYRQAAAQGNAAAQHNLGLMYTAGEGVEQDYVTAYAWLNIAVANGSESGKKFKGLIAALRTAEDISKAQALSKEMLKKNPKLLNQ